MKQIRSIIKDNYDLTVMDMLLLDCHFGTKIYKVNTDKGEYIVKAMTDGIVLSENEGHITEYLFGKGIKTARLCRSEQGSFIVKTTDKQFTIQEYIRGITYAVNTAPNWLMIKSAEMLGRINAALLDFPDLPVRFGTDFFNKEAAVSKKYHFENELAGAEKELIYLYTEQIHHLERISEFEIYTDKLTYTNSHGDYMYN